jgi:hypothetical protein
VPVASVPVGARLVTLMSRADTWVMFSPGTVRRSSAKFCEVARSMVAASITVIVAGVFSIFSSVREPLTTTVSS